MALVNVTNVVVLDNPTTFTNPLTFEVTFECLQELDADLEWKVIYVGSAEDTRYDQVLEEVDVGPIPVGVNKFVLTAESPDPATIPPTDLVGVTVTLITCCYKNKEFIRVGYYVNNEHNDPAINAEIQEGRIPPAEMLDPACITRNILADKPRVTRFPIDWNAAPGDVGSVATDEGAAAGGMEDEMGVGEDTAVDEMVATGDNEPGDAEGSESMVSDGDDDGSVDLDEGSGDAMAEGGDPDMDADSSGAEEMEDTAGDEARAGAAAAGVLTTASDQNVRPILPQSSAHVVGQPNCGANGNPGANQTNESRGDALLC